MSTKPSSYEVFDQDARERGSYSYTTDRLSSRTSNARINAAMFGFNLLAGKSVIDIGCGDGTYTAELLAGGADTVLGVEPGAEAVEVARRKNAPAGGRVPEFQVCNAYDLESLGRTFDVAVVRGVIHHIPDPLRGIRQICKVARDILVIEPNGYNPVLKLIEKISPYHREHQELSYTRAKLAGWFAEAGATLQSHAYIGLVPFFCPDWMVRPLKAMEGLVESVPLVRTLMCGQVVMHFRSGSGTGENRQAQG
jgi:2-polyprenyl-3-methyl-5-hydroxy-6-metoxy-1,4-benzoquinol methylase